MPKVRRRLSLDSELLSRARSVLGTATETETIAEALRRVVEAEDETLLLAEGHGAFPDWADPYHEWWR